MNDPVWPTPVSRPDAFEQLPGLLRRWEVQRVLATGHHFHTEEAATAVDGSQLFVVYRRRHNSEDNSDE